MRLLLFSIWTWGISFLFSNSKDVIVINCEHDIFAVVIDFSTKFIDLFFLSMVSRANKKRNNNRQNAAL